MQHHQYQNYQTQNPQEINEKLLAQERQKLDKNDPLRILKLSAQEKQKIEKSVGQDSTFQGIPEMVQQQRIMPIELTAQQKADYENEQLMQ